MNYAKGASKHVPHLRISSIVYFDSLWSMIYNDFIYG